MATATNRAARSREDQEEARQQRLKAAREDQVRVLLRKEGRVPAESSKVVVSNVYGDAYRVNCYSETAQSDAGVITTSRIIHSAFVKIKVAQEKDN